MLSLSRQAKINLSNLNGLVSIAKMDLKGNKTSRVTLKPSKATENEAMVFRQISQMVGLQEPCEVKVDLMDRFYLPQIL